jgi:hypothetical protein
MRYDFERDFLTIIKEVIEEQGFKLIKVPSKTNDYYILENGKVVLVFSYWPKSMKSTWQLTDEIVKTVDLKDPYFNLRKVRIKRFPYRITMNVSVVRYDLILILKRITTN